MEQLLGLAKEGLGYTLFVTAALVNIYQYKLNNSLRDSHLADWKGALGLANTLSQASQEFQKTSQVVWQGTELKLQRIMDKLGIT